MGIETLALALMLSAAGVDDVTPINQPGIRIPIHVDPARRVEIQQLILFVSSDQGKTWNQHSVAGPEQDGFSFTAPLDGVYWFSIQVVDKQGKRDPPNIYDVPPSQKVVIDTLPPQVRLTAARVADEVAVSWEIQEDHLNIGSVKLDYRTSDMPPEAWNGVSFAAAPMGQTRFRPASGGTVTVRMQAQDTAGNLGQARVDAVTGSMPLAGSGSSAPVYSTSLSQAPLTNVAAPAWSPASSPPATPVMKPPEAPAAPTNWTYPAAAASDPNQRMVASSMSNSGYDSSTPTMSVSRLSRGAAAPLQYVNSTQVMLDYVAEHGPSGLGKVELYMTRDDGRSWEYFCDDKGIQAPGDITSGVSGSSTRTMTANLPGEGTYGFIIVVQNKAGVGRKPPMAGDTPEIRLEVDTTPPAVCLYEPQPDPNQKDSLILHWEMNEKNPASDGVTLQWSDSKNNWQTIAENLPSTARSYTWKLPAQMAPSVYLRVVARDSAGNVSIAETQKPQLIDLKEPLGRLVRVRVAAGQ